MRPPTRRQQHRRAGMTSVLAMLYLILFASLAVGFYAATNTSVQISSNERHARQAMLATESGMEYMRHVMGNLDIPTGTTTSQLWVKVCSQVVAQIDNTPNFGNARIYPPDAASTSWTIPAPLQLPGGGQCTITLMPHVNDPDKANRDRVDVIVAGVEASNGGNSTPLHRRILITFDRKPKYSNIFDFGVASRSAISMGGNAVITGAADSLARGSVLSATSSAVPLTMTGSPKISGDFSYTNPNGAPVYGNGSIAGYNSSSSDFLKHVHSGITPPEFPTIDTSTFEKFVPPTDATGSSVISASPPSSRRSFTNIRIKAGVNPTFAAGTVIQGVVFIETPNQVTFTGGVTIQGVIAVQNNPTGDSNSNIIKFGGNVTHQGVETLPKTDPFVANVDNVQVPLAQLTGSFLLAPKFDLIMRGNSNSVGGTIVAGKIDIAGTAGANVKGTVINLDDTSVAMTGTSDIVISASGSDNYPSGVSFGSHFVANAKTYQELQ